MALVVVCGQPSSGKSTVAADLKARFTNESASVLVVDEPSLYLEKNVSYKGAAQEKKTRATLKATVERSLNKRTVVIMDALNNIKGYRYELWCIARAAGVRYCMVECDTPIEQCRQWNESRDTSECYERSIFDELAARFEAPDSRNRWDAPLFRIRPAHPDAPATLQAVVAAVSGSESLPKGVAPAKALEPTCATSNGPAAAPNLLHELDHAAQQVVAAVADAQATAAGGPAGLVQVICGTKPETLNLQRTVGLPELRRHKRDFLRLATQNSFSRLGDPGTAQRLFVDYLRERVC
eukprot:jgi/Botrbrau1/6473/Bobra.0034s0047.1